MDSLDASVALCELHWAVLHAKPGMYKLDDLPEVTRALISGELTVFEALSVLSASTEDSP